MVRIVRSSRMWLRPRATLTLIVVNLAWFIVVETIIGKSPTDLLRAGGMAGVLVANGQWYRLLSSLFVHLSLLHVLLNMVSLWSLYLIELIFGAPAFLTMYFLSGLAGNLASVWLMSPYDVAGGASGAIFGIFGAAVVLGFQGVFPRVARNQMLLILAINIVYDLTNPHIDLVAHLGGLAVGALLAFVYPKMRRHLAVFRICALILSVAAALSLIVTLAVPLQLRSLA